MWKSDHVYEEEASAPLRGRPLRYVLASIIAGVRPTHGIGPCAAQARCLGLSMGVPGAHIAATDLPAADLVELLSLRRGRKPLTADQAGVLATGPGTLLKPGR